MGRSHKGVIVIADDETAFRENIQDALEDAGYFVLTGRDGHEALARMRGISGAALAIVDLNMPRMDGWELVARMHESQDLAWIPVLVVSSNRPEPITGVSRFLKKPVALKVLLHAVEEMMA